MIQINLITETPSTLHKPIVVIQINLITETPST